MITDPLKSPPSELIVWRLDPSKHAATWDSGEGALRGGGRWNSKGRLAVYCSLDAATTILEVAVHKTFATLDAVPHTLTAAKIQPGAALHRIDPDDVPNPNWLEATAPSSGQQAFGDALLRDYDFILMPSVVTNHSWNLIFDPTRVAGKYALLHQERFALDTRLSLP